MNKKVSKENFTCGFAAKEFSQFCTLKTEQYESKSNNRGNVKMLFRSYFIDQQIGFDVYIVGI